MGQGQADIALSLLRDCARSGEWLCLKNLHLAVSWLPVLEKEVYTLNKSPAFRLFLTSEPHAKFPSTLLEQSLKVVRGSAGARGVCSHGGDGRPRLLMSAWVTCADVRT